MITNPADYRQGAIDARRSMGEHVIQIHADTAAMSVLPTRKCDWYACWSDYDEGTQCGHGATPEEAVRDLLDNYPDETPTK